MSWCALDVRAAEDDRPSVAAWLVQRTGQAVEEKEDGTLLGVTTDSAAAQVLADLAGAFGPAVSALARRLPDQPWETAWRHGLAPRQIGRLLVAPSWTLPASPASFTIAIDPETAFGTGEHGSTRTALRLLDRWIAPGARVVDFGSGSGILAIAAVKLGAARAIGIDIDPEAEPVALANARRNGVADRTVFLTGAAGELAGLAGPADLMLSNILRTQNEALLPLVRELLAPGGIAIFAGMEKCESGGFRSVLADRRFDLLDEMVDDGWWGVAVRPG